MAEKVTKTMKVAASGILDIEDDDIFIEVEEKGTFSLKKLLKVVDGLSVKISCTYDKEQESPEDEDEELKVDNETGEILN